MNVVAQTEQLIASNNPSMLAVNKTHTSLEALNRAFLAQFQAPVTNVVSVYWQGRLLGDAQLKLSTGLSPQLSLMMNDALLSSLPVMPAVREAIIQALKQPLNTNQPLATEQPQTKESHYCVLYCDELVSQQIRLKYRANYLDVSLILPSRVVRDYYHSQEKNDNIQFSLAGDSTLLSIDAGDRGVIQDSHVSHSDYLNYVFHSLHGRYSLTSTRNTANKHELFASYALENNRLFSVGRINSQLVIPFFQEFYGVELSSENLRYPLYQQQDVIYEDYFDANAQLRIYVNDILVTQQSVLQGYQRILANSLPAGDYEARLVFTDIHGQVREVKQHIHRSAFPSLFRRAPQWLIQAGTLNVPPNTERKSYASIMYGRQLTNNVASRAQLSLYNGAILSKVEWLHEYNRLLNDISLSTLNSNFYQAIWSQTLQQDWGRLSYQWDYAQARQSATANKNTASSLAQAIELNLTQQLDMGQHRNTQQLTLEYRISPDWWVGTGLTVGEQQNNHIFQWRAHTSKSIKTGIFSRPTQFYLETSFQKTTHASADNNRTERSVRLSVSQPFDVGRRTQLYARTSTGQGTFDSQDKTNSGFTLTSQAVPHLEQSYLLSNQWDTGAHTFNVGQTYQHEFAEINGQYQLDQACNGCAVQQGYSAGLRTDLVYSAGNITAFRHERGGAALMVNNPSDATIQLDLGAIQFTVPPNSTRAVSVLPYIEYPVRYKLLTENTASDYAITPALNQLRVRPNETARVVVTQQHQQYIGVRLLDSANQPLATQRIIVEGVNKPFITDTQGGVVIQLASEQPFHPLNITVAKDVQSTHSDERHCQVDLPHTIKTTYYYAGEVTCHE